MFKCFTKIPPLHPKIIMIVIYKTLLWNKTNFFLLMIHRIEIWNMRHNPFDLDIFLQCYSFSYNAHCSNRINLYRYNILCTVIFSNLLINPFLYGRIIYNECPKNWGKFFCSASQQYFNAIGCQIYNLRFRFLRNNIDYSAICLAWSRNSFGSMNIHECWYLFYT